MIFGEDNFKLVCETVTICDNAENTKKDLSKIESEYSEFVSDTGIRSYKIKGQRWYPVLYFEKLNKVTWLKLKALTGLTATLTPFSDNTDFSFDCIIESVQPVWRDGQYWKNEAVLKLKSVGYPTINSKAVV